MEAEPGLEEEVSGGDYSAADGDESEWLPPPPLPPPPPLRSAS